jgi:hypothetical protein
MNGAGGPGTNQELNLNEQNATMSLNEKVSMWVALLLSIFMAGFCAVTVLTLARKSGHLSLLGSQSSTPYMLMILLVASSAFIGLATVSFFRMMRWKKRTGSIYPSGEELRTRHTRHQIPDPLWWRFTTAVIWSFGACFYIHNAVTSPHPRILDWVVAVLFWLMAGTSIRSAFSPARIENQGAKPNTEDS